MRVLAMATLCLSPPDSFTPRSPTIVSYCKKKTDKWASQPQQGLLNPWSKPNINNLPWTYALVENNQSPVLKNTIVHQSWKILIHQPLLFETQFTGHGFTDGYLLGDSLMIGSGTIDKKGGSKVFNMSNDKKGNRRKVFNISTLSGNERMVSWMSARLAASSTSASVASMLPYLMLYLHKGSSSRCLRHI